LATVPDAGKAFVEEGKTERPDFQGVDLPVFRSSTDELPRTTGPRIGRARHGLANYRVYRSFATAAFTSVLNAAASTRSEISLEIFGEASGRRLSGGMSTVK